MSRWGLVTACMLTSVACNNSEFDIAEGTDSGAADAQVFDDTAAIPDTTSSDAPFDSARPIDAGPEINESINYAREPGTAITATSTNAGWPADRLVDGVLSTSWFAASGACTGASALYTCASEAVTVKLAGDRRIGRVTIHGNREYADGWDVITARLELTDASSAKVFEAPLTFPPPDRDLTVTVPFLVARHVRVVLQTAEASAPGFAEIGVYGP